MTILNKALRIQVLSIVLIASLVFGSSAFASTQKAGNDVITKVIRTPEYTLNAQGVSAPDTTFNTTPGAPQLPVHALMIELPVSGNWTVTYNLGTAQVLSQQVTIPSVPVPNPLPDGPDPLSANQLSDLGVSVRPDPAIYRANAFYPASPVEWSEAMRNGDQRFLPVRVYPFQYNPVTKQLKYYPEVQVSVQLSHTSQDAPVKGTFVPSHEPFILTTSAARIHTTQPGMYRLTYNDLSAAGIPVGAGGVDPATFAILYDGQPVSIQVTGDGDNAFEPGELVIFYAEAYTKRWQNFNVYWLTYGGAPSTAMATRTVTPTGSEPLVTTIDQISRIENNLSYAALAPLRTDEEDHFLGNLLSVTTAAPTSRVTYDLGMNDQLTAGTVRVKARFHRSNRQAAFNPDNAIGLSLNNHQVEVYRWDGETEVEVWVDTTVSASWLDGTPNVINLDANMDYLTSVSPGITFYRSLIDWVEVTYPALADAEGDKLYIPSMASGANKVQVTGFTTNAIRVYDIRDPKKPVELMTKSFTPSGGTYTLNFWDADLASPTYYLSSEAALLAPSLFQVDTPSTWGTPNNNYDYIAIVPSIVEHGQTATDLINAAMPLLNYRQTSAGGGYRVAIVNVQDIYDEFGYGKRSPLAIREFLAYAYWNWNPTRAARPQYVLLLGDGTYDFNGYTGTAMRNLIMPYLGYYDMNFGEVPADNRFVSVDLDGSGNLDLEDYTPNMAIARIPAQTVAQVSNVVNKTISYETTTTPGAWQKRAIFSAGNCVDTGGNLQAHSENINSWLPSGYEKVRIYYGDPATCPMSTASTAAQFDVQAKQAFDTQAVYYQWLGHGSFIHWGGGPDIRQADINNFAPNTVFPLTAHYACATGYFIYLTGTDQSLGEDFLVRWADRGSVVDFSGSGQHYAFSMEILGQSMMKSLFQEEIMRAGLATNEAKMLYYAATPLYHDVLDTMILFGDPATRLRAVDGQLLSNYSFAAESDWAPAGHTASFTLELMNFTPWTATQVPVTMDLAAELSAPTAMTATNSTPTYDPALHQVRWQGEVAGNSSTFVSFDSTVSPDISTCTTLTVTGQFTDPGTQNMTPFSSTINVAVPDVDCNGRVDIVDIQLVAARWNTAPADPVYHPRYDLDGDHAIGVGDLIIVAEHWN